MLAASEIWAGHITCQHHWHLFYRANSVLVALGSEYETNLSPRNRKLQHISVQIDQAKPTSDPDLRKATCLSLYFQEIYTDFLFALLVPCNQLCCIRDFFSIMLFIRVRSIPTILKLPVRKNTWGIPYVLEVWVQTQISYWEEAGIKNCLVHFIGFSFRWPTVQARDHIFLHVWEVQTFWRTSLIKYVIPLNIYCCQTLRTLPRKREELFLLFKSSIWSVRNSILVHWGGWEDSVLLKSQGTEGKRWQIDQILYKIRSRYRTDFSECMEFTLTSAIRLTRSFTFFFFYKKATLNIACFNKQYCNTGKMLK